MFFKKINAYIQISRPFFKWFISISALTAGMIFAKNGFPELITWILGAIIFGILGQSGVRFINDYFDYDLDKDQKKDPFENTRQILKGTVKKKEALIIGLILHLLGLFLSIIFFNSFFTLMFFLFSLSSFLYSFSFKKIFLINTITIISMYGLYPILAGYQTYGNILTAPIPFWIFALIGGTIGIGSSNAKDATDIEGDKKHGVQNLFTIFGFNTALKICIISVLSPYIILPFLVYLNIFPVNTLLIELIGISFFILIIPKLFNKKIKEKFILPILFIHNTVFIFIFPLLVFL